MNNTILNNYTSIIKEKAKDLGFSYCGIAKADLLENEARKLELWLNSNYHGEMQYMENYFDKRIDPRKLFEGAKSIISLSYNYYTDKKQIDENAPKISKYAYGYDYHEVIKTKLKTLLLHISENIGEVNGRAFVDSAPILERAWAVRAGLGWIGKNTMLIHKKGGSFFFLAEIILDIDLLYDIPETKNHCGSCTRCIDACPTNAIDPSGYVKANKCISYATIELRKDIPEFFKNKMQNWMFGCDICNDVCPWNKFATNHNESLFQANEIMLKTTKKEWIELSKDLFNVISKKSAIRRTKYEGLKRNIQFLENI